MLKSFNPKDEISNPHFFILNKGNNSGKPLLNPCPNCFVIQFSNVEDKELVYWLLFGLWQSKAFHYYLRGSVIPFVVLRDIKQCIANGLEKVEVNPEQLEKALTAFNGLQAMEMQIKQNLKLIQEAKRILFHQYLK